MANVIPNAREIRTRIENLPDTIEKIMVGSWQIPMDIHKIKLGFMYQYLVAGRIGEATGKYAPFGRQAIHMKIKGEDAVLFAHKTSKKHNDRGWSLRPILLPLNPAYEPWAKPLMDYMHTMKEKQPFIVAKNPETSKRYYEAVMNQYFSDLKWCFITYRRKVKDEMTSVPSRWKRFTTHELRKRRIKDLEMYYGFDALDMRTYGGWDSKMDFSGITTAMKHYLTLDIDESPENVRMLATMATRYFYKLLKSIDVLMNPEEIDISGIEIIT